MEKLALLQRVILTCVDGHVPAYDGAERVARLAPVSGRVDLRLELFRLEGRDDQTVVVADVALIEQAAHFDRLLAVFVPPGLCVLSWTFGLMFKL